jgi:hypothetical protein
MPDRKPKPPPFSVGTRLRYVGTDRAGVVDADGNAVPYKELGLEVTVKRTKPGRQGTLRQIPGEWDNDEPPLDTTTDGYSVYEVEVPGREPFGRIIWPDSAHEWERL